MKESCVCFGGEGGVGWGRKSHEWVVYIACFPAEGKAYLELWTMNSTDPGGGLREGEAREFNEGQSEPAPMTAPVCHSVHRMGWMICLSFIHLFTLQ